MSEQPNDGWIAWGGGECPVEFNASVYWRERNGREGGPHPAGLWDWGHDIEDSENDIVAYRMVQA